jgi:uncharacterized protein (TIGR02996 family)
MERIRREFFPEDFSRALAILRRWDPKDCAPGEHPSRLLTAVLNLALGRLPLLREYTAGNLDFRDVLLWGEYSKSKHLRCLVFEPGGEEINPTEQAFLDNIRANPRDNTTRLVYADWLEEHGDRRAGYLRLLCEWLGCRTAEEQQVIEQERKLRASLDPRWLARIRGLPVHEKKNGVCYAE